MGNQSIEEKVKMMICDKMCENPDEVTRDSHIQNDLGADSLDAVEIIMECERVFNIAILDDEVDALDTVGKLADFVEKRVSESTTSEQK